MIKVRGFLLLIGLWWESLLDSERGPMGAMPGGEFTPVRVAQYEETAVWSVAWSTMGNMLAVADGRGQVTFWKEQADGQWVQLSETDGSC